MQWVKDPVLPKLWHMSQLQLGFGPWPGNFHVLQGVAEKEKKKEREKKVGRKGERKGGREEGQITSMTNILCEKRHWGSSHRGPVETNLRVQFQSQASFKWVKDLALS